MTYVILHHPLGDKAIAYNGMDSSAVTTLLTPTGFGFDFVDLAAYMSFVLAHQPTPMTPEQLTTFFRSQAVDSLNIGVDQVSKLHRAVLLTILDEINILRTRDRERAVDVAGSGTLAALKTAWALQSSLTNRTAVQAKQSIQDKINAGDAD